MIAHFNLYSNYLSGIGLLTLLLTACNNSGMSDLEDYVNETKQAGNPYVEPLPVITAVANYSYESNQLKDPFQPITLMGVDSSPPPIPTCPPLSDIGRVRSGLELMPLDALQLSGTIAMQDSQGHPILWGLVQSQSDPVTIYRVKVGDYMGDNYGKIINISKEEITVLEQIPDTNNCWQENLVTISLLADQ